MAHQKAILVILDGFGDGKDYPFNSVLKASMPFYNELIGKFPRSQLFTHGESVGLPGGVMGNSEVGHMTLGAGRVKYQDLSRISRAIEDQSFFKNQILRSAMKKAAETGNRVHVMGLLSDGGVHSHIDHFHALLDLAQKMSIPEVSVHAFLDGRDTPPDSSPIYLKRLLQHPSFSSKGGSHATLASLMGRYWAMDRDKRWERTQKAYDCICGKIEPQPALDPISAVEAYRQSASSLGPSDEFVEPVLFDSSAAMKDGDVVIFANFRADRARQITESLLEAKHFQPAEVVAMTEYDAKLNTPVAFNKEKMNQIFGQWVSELNLKQFRIAETEKYAHVTFFFNGGQEAAFAGEDRLLIPSPKEISTYDQKPEMSANEITDALVKQIESGASDFILVNYANPDMVGHTGNFEASIKALEVVDRCLDRIYLAAKKSGYDVLLTADHGNVEEMQDCQGRAHTQHTLNPVPLVYFSHSENIADSVQLKDGTLADVMPTLCDIMKIDIPQEVTGKSLIKT